MRQYKRENVVYDRRWDRNVLYTHLNDGLKQVHIGDDVWLFGKQRYKPIEHMVIYAPDRKTEHHVFGETVNMLLPKKSADFRINRHGNEANESLVKIYILTSILDDRRNWCFNLNKIPENGKLKVIYSNGTVRNINFTGEFHKISIGRKYGSIYIENCNNVSPIAYRKN